MISDQQPDIRALLLESLDQSARIAVRLSRSRQTVAPLFPLDGAAFERLTEEMEVALDAMLKRLENLQDILARRVFKGVLLALDEPLDGLSARDIANRLEALGALPDATQWSHLVRLRNRLAHDYPTRPSLQADRLSEAFAAIPTLLSITQGVLEFADRRMGLTVAIPPAISSVPSR